MIVRSQTFVRCPSAIRKNSEKALLYGMPRAEKEGKIGAQRAFLKYHQTYVNLYYSDK